MHNLCKALDFNPSAIKQNTKNNELLRMLVQAYNPKTWEVEVERSGIQGHCQLHREKSKPVWAF